MKVRAFGTRAFELPIVGESNYQPTLREPDNPYEEKAIKITLKSGTTIGYLGRTVAQKYARAVAACEERGIRVKCQAKLAGGEPSDILFWKETKNIGGRLDLESPRKIDSGIKGSPMVP